MVPNIESSERGHVAYQILSSMHDRVAEQPGDFFDAAVGAVVGAAADADQHPELRAAEAFMRAWRRSRPRRLVHSSSFTE